MNKMTFGAATIAMAFICGCASQSDYNALATDCKAMNERLARIERDLYKVEIKQAPRVQTSKKDSPKAEPAKAAGIEVLDTKVKSFISEYVGVEFGDSLDTIIAKTKSRRVLGDIKLTKPFKHFDTANVSMTDGKLTTVRIFAAIDKKFSKDSVMQRFKEDRDDLAFSLGYREDFGLPPELQHSGKRSDIRISYDINERGNYYKIIVSFKNTRLTESIDRKLSTQGEELPEAK